jgi:glutathione peroxidase-family protein
MRAAAMTNKGGNVRLAQLLGVLLFVGIAAGCTYTNRYDQELCLRFL